MFEGRRLVIATKHGKEAFLAPILERELGVHCFILPLFDSDIFGTFSGEVERLEDPVFTNTASKSPPLAHPQPTHPCSPLRNTAQNTANPALKMRPRSHISTSPHIPNPSFRQIIVFRINLNNTD